MNIVYPDETLLNVTFHLSRHCLPRPVCPNMYSKYGNVGSSHFGHLKFCFGGLKRFLLKILLYVLITVMILAYSWARPAILVVGKGRGGMFLFLLFLHFHSCSSFFPVPLFHLLCSLFYLFSLSLGDDTK